MDKSKVRFTGLEEKVLYFLFVNPTASFRGRALARQLNVSPTAISNSIRSLEKKNLVRIKKDFTLSISLNRDNEKTFVLKRIANIKAIYESGIESFLSDKFPGSAIVLFGSYAYGEDTEDSDVDIAIIGYNKQIIENEELVFYEKYLERPIQLHFFKSIKEINKNLKENIINGIVLKGAVKI